MKTNGPVFALVILIQIWAAHAIAFFAHEYGHSFTAAALGWKADPLVLDFGDLSWSNLLAMYKIDERVDYRPIFQAGHGAQAALIAAAGVLADAVLYPLAIFGFVKCRSAAPAWSLFFFWLCVMCVGNFIDYVPTRCFSPKSDMHTVEIGLGVAPISVTVGLGLPFLAGGVYLFVRLLPDARRSLFTDQVARQRALVVLTTFLMFVFFPAAGFEPGVGSIARVIALTCALGVFPLVTFFCWPRRQARRAKGRRSPGARPGGEW